MANKWFICAGERRLSGFFVLEYRNCFWGMQEADMYLLLILFWIILNGKITIEILLLGVLFAVAVYAFANQFLGLTWNKELKFWKYFFWGLKYLAILMKEIILTKLFRHFQVRF